MSNLAFVIGVSLNKQNNYEVTLVELGAVNPETLQSSIYEIKVVSFDEFLRKYTKAYSKNASHKSAAEDEKIYPSDRVSPDLYKIPLYKVYTPASEADANGIKNDRKVVQFELINGTSHNYVLVENAGYTVIGKVYCLCHRAWTQNYNDCYYYDRQGRRSPSPAWFATYASARYRKDRVNDGVTIDTHYISII